MAAGAVLGRVYRRELAARQCGAEPDPGHVSHDGPCPYDVAGRVDGLKVAISFLSYACATPAAGATAVINMPIAVGDCVVLLPITFGYNATFSPSFTDDGGNSYSRVVDTTPLGSTRNVFAFVNFATASASTISSTYEGTLPTNWVIGAVRYSGVLSIGNTNAAVEPAVVTNPTITLNLADPQNVMVAAFGTIFAAGTISPNQGTSRGNCGSNPRSSVVEVTGVSGVATAGINVATGGNAGAVAVELVGVLPQPKAIQVGFTGDSGRIVPFIMP